jgi:hypothetical protein
MQSPAPEAKAPESVKWQALHNIAFRWVFSYFVCYFLPHPPSLCKPAFVCLGQNMLHVGYEISTKFNGSGDTTYHWMVLLCNLVTAALVTVIWSVLDRRRDNYLKLEMWLKLVLRLSLWGTMLTYGASKVFEGQFPQPGPTRLAETFGEASPMGLLWTFMGASRPYSIFGGLAEMVPGLLLFFPPLAGLGAVLCAAVMFHIFMLNLCYDVPVKIYSCQLFLTGVYLALPVLKRLAGFFLFNRKVEPLPVVPMFKREAFNELFLALQIFIGVVLAGYSLWGAAYRERHDYRESIANTPMYGVWQVDKRQPDKGAVGTNAPAAATSGTTPGVASGVPSEVGGISTASALSSPWHKVIFEHPGYITVLLVDGERKYYGVSVDSSSHKLILSSARDPEWQRVFSMTELAPNVVNLESNGDGVPSRVIIRRIEDSKFLLKSRGFHWINEVPYNR